MILSVIELIPMPRKREEILELLRYSVDHVRTRRGCLKAGVYEACDEQRTILYLEHWSSEGEMRHHIQSSLYRSVLNVLDLAAGPPDISFHRVSDTKAMELITALRTPGIPA